MAYAGADANPFDQATLNLSPETAALEDVMQKVARYSALNLRVAMPCKIVAVKGDQTVDVQPLLQTYLQGQGCVNMAQLHAVPVAMPMGADFRITYPIAPGDLGLAVFCDRNMDAFVASDGTLPQDPQDSRSHALSDAVFYPGLAPTMRQTTDVQPSGDLVLQNGQMTLRLKKSGQISAHNGAQELVDLLDQLLSANLQLISDLSASLVLTAFGPAGFIASSVAQFNQVAQSLQSLKANLDTFKAG